MVIKMYSLVGRYMNGTEVTGYQLIDEGSKESRRYSKEALAFLIGKRVVINCDAQIYNGDIVLRGIGIQINELPVVCEDGRIKNIDRLGRIGRNERADDTLSKQIIIGKVEKENSEGNKVIRYIIMNAGGVKGIVSKEELIGLVKDGRIGNARIQHYNGKIILRGVGIDLRNLPIVN